METVQEVGHKVEADETGGYPDFHDYALSIPEPKVGRLNMEDFPYQVGLYSQEVMDAEEVVEKKSTQVGASSQGIRAAIYACDVWGDTALYIFPTQTHVHDFSDERIDPIIEDSTYLTERIPAHHVKQKKLKRIGLGWLHLRGSESKAGAQSVAADFLFFDEYDDLDKTNVVQIERRLSGARAAGRTPRVRRIGRPTLPNYGIAKAYARSDRRTWHVTCPQCGVEQPITWQANVRWYTDHGGDQVGRPGADRFDDPDDVVEVWRACRECDARLDVKQGRWLATRPGARVIGFHITQLIVPNADLAQLVKNSRKTEIHEIEAFHNNDLGEEYSHADTSLSREAIAAACSFGAPMVDGYSAGNVVTMGVDVASSRPLSARISEQLPNGKRRALWIGAPESFDAVVRLMRLYNVNFCAIDANPERRQARMVQKTFPGRVQLVNYTILPKAPVFDYNPAKGTVTVQRTYAIDAMMDSIRAQRNIPPAEPGEEYYEHLTNLHGRTEVNAKGQKVRTYVSTGPDDYAHAEVYDLVATETWRLSQGVAQMQHEAVQPIADEEIGYERLDLDRPSDDYDPGFGGPGY